MPETGQVRELRLSVTVPDYDEALLFYRDVLGLTDLGTYTADGGRGRIPAGGRATLELVDPTYAAYNDQVEVGRRVAGPIRVAFEVGDSNAMTAKLVEAGASMIAPATRAPWGPLHSRADG